MEFDRYIFLTVTVILFILMVGLFWKGAGSFSEKDLTVKDVIKKAGLGEESATFFVSDMSYDVCKIEGAEGECGVSELGVGGE